MSLPPPIRKCTLYYVTDRKGLAGSTEERLRLLLERIEAAGRAGVDWIQMREKDLSGRALAELVGAAVRRVPRSCRILVNDRLDVACTARAGGVHLAEQSLRVSDAKRLIQERRLGTHDFLVGVSTHSLLGAEAAELEGADYVIFGPVFPTPSKLSYGLPQGVERLAEVCRRVRIPVLAIGGVTTGNVGECVAAGAAGIAAIRLFQDAEDMAAVVSALQSY